MEKQNISKKLLVQLEERQASLLKNYETYKQASIDAPGAMESHSDTSKVEFGNLASNIAKEMEDTNKLIKLVQNISDEKGESIELGSFAKIEENGKTFHFYIVPEGAGGQKIDLDDDFIQTVSVDSLIGKVLLSKRVGEEVELIVPAGKRKLKVLEVG